MHRSSSLIKAKAWKCSIIFAAIPWCAASSHSKLLIMRQVRCLYVTTPSFEFQPTCEPTARMGGDNVNLARQYGRRWQRNWHSFGQSLHPSRVFAANSLVEMGRVATAAPLQGAVCVYLTTYNGKTGRCTDGQAGKEANKQWMKPRKICFTYFVLEARWSDGGTAVPEELIK